MSLTEERHKETLGPDGLPLQEIQLPHQRLDSSIRASTENDNSKNPEVIDGPEAVLRPESIHIETEGDAGSRPEDKPVTQYPNNGHLGIGLSERSSTNYLPLDKNQRRIILKRKRAMSDPLPGRQRFKLSSGENSAMFAAEGGVNEPVYKTGQWNKNILSIKDSLVSTMSNNHGSGEEKTSELGDGMRDGEETVVDDEKTLVGADSSSEDEGELVEVDDEEGEESGSDTIEEDEDDSEDGIVRYYESPGEASGLSDYFKSDNEDSSSSNDESETEEMKRYYQCLH